MPLTTVNPALLDTQAQYTGFKNRIINGDMRIDQRNAGASVTPTASAYVTDRWKAILSQSSKFSFQRSTTVPAGFQYSEICTSLSAFSSAAGDIFRLSHFIEGFNTADLDFGSANAQTVTLSFWVRSSLTGTFAAGLINDSATRSYVSTYTISAANTWEYKTITIPGDTTGTWDKTNNVGIGINFDLGSGTSSNTTANSWQAGAFSRVSGAQSVVGTNGATFYITGVQLEKGSTATSFDYRPYGTELQLCQRYFEVLPVNSGDSDQNYLGQVVASTLADMGIKFSVTKRTSSPTVTLNSITQIRIGGSNITPSGGFSVIYTSSYGATVRATHSGLTGAQCCNLIGGSGTPTITAAAEL